MSLISAKHLVGPFTNKVHLGTILALSLAFLLFRLFGGTIQRRPAYQSANNRPLAAVEPSRMRSDTFKLDPEEENVAPPQREPAAAKPSRPAFAQEDDSISNLLSATRKGSAKAAAPTPAAGTGKSLEDIEKSLGLR